MNLTEEQMEERAKNKEILKDKNIDAVAQLLIDSREHNHKVQAEMVELRKNITTLTQQHAELQGQLNAIKAMGLVNMGTGPTAR